ncbi:leucine--tRNA ligase [Bacteroidia bacterium]|nr:leucine--tRNA ligase [Bacteroidia bacterium]
MEYNHKEIEAKWRKYWVDNNTYKIDENPYKEKFYVLDMFPYPSGAGLHVGHPLGYIASDIYARYKRLKGFNVLHPMGYDAYGLPTEQYAIQTGQHPTITTDKNIARYREQLDKIGFSFDWSRQVTTCDPSYYKWTQWAFIQMFNSYYCYDAQQARPITELVNVFDIQGTKNMNIACSEELSFTAEEWNTKSEKEQQEILMNYRLAYLSETTVNWCEALGTVLANDEVSNGLSIRGGHPVERKKLRQWSLRISAYAERLLQGLERLDWSDAIKDTQRNWIGKSKGCEMLFEIITANNEQKFLQIFTTRADTIFGVTFMVLAPEHEYIDKITTSEQKQAVEQYVAWAKNRSERERQAEVNNITGVFTGTYAKNPFNDKKIPIWVSDYVLMGYGTGAIMAVPAHDSRDFKFAKHFNLPIIPVVEPLKTISQNENHNEAKYQSLNEAIEAKEGIMINSDFLNGLDVKDAINKAIETVEEKGIGKGKINYRLRDAVFSRQRYWGEPFPIYYKDGMPYSIDEKDLPLQLPDIDKFLPTETGEPPLARAKNWTYKIGGDSYPLEVNTMPGFAGSSAYYLRYMDPLNNNELVSKEKNNYWKSVDLYVGGSEHATGHLIYSRFWNKLLFDIGAAIEDEPFKKMVNQGMILGRTNFAYRITGTNKFVSFNLKNQYETQEIRVDINIVDNDVLDIEKFQNWMPDFKNAEFILEDGKYICGYEVEKMSKSFHNVQNPDDIVEKYGADTLRLYEMFLGPISLAKPWSTSGIEGTHRFIKKLWKLFFDAQSNANISNEKATADEQKVLHKTIKKIAEDTENFTFNTSVSTFMIAVNELSDLKCNKREILQNLVIVLAPYCPYLAEELWSILGNNRTVFDANFPEWKEEYIKENAFTYAISFNGKTRFTLSIPAGTIIADIEKLVLANEQTSKWLEDKPIKKIIVVPNKIVNIVIG